MAVEKFESEEKLEDGSPEFSIRPVFEEEEIGVMEGDFTFEEETEEESQEEKTEVVSEGETGDLEETSEDSNEEESEETTDGVNEGVNEGVTEQKFDWDALNDEVKSTVIEKLTGGKAKSVEDLQNVLSNSEKPAIPKEVAETVALLEVAKEKGLDARSAFLVQDMLGSINEDMTDKDYLYTKMAIEDLTQGLPVPPKETFDDWYEDKYSNITDFMEARQHKSSINEAKKFLSELKSDFTNLDTSNFKTDTGTKEAREKYLSSVNEFSSNPDFGTFEVDLGKTKFSFKTDDKSKLKDNVSNFFQTLNSKWFDENGNARLNEIAKDIELITNAPKHIKAAIDKARVEEREALEAGRRNLSVNQPKPKPTSTQKKTPRTIADALAQGFKIQRGSI